MDGRQERIKAIQDAMPDDAFPVGFGGSSVELETLVFSVARDVPGFSRLPYSFEVRIPVFPDAWDDLDTIESEYGCLAARDWDELDERLSSF